MTKELLFDSWQVQDIFPFSKAPNLTPIPTQTHIHWVTSALPQGVKQPGHVTCLRFLQGNMLQRILNENKLILFQHTVYMVYQERKCFMRCGTETVECSVQQKKQDVMDAEVKALEESLRCLRVPTGVRAPHVENHCTSWSVRATESLSSHGLNTL